MSTYGSLSNLKEANYYDLIKIEGIGTVKALEILALIELSKRFNQNAKFNNKTKIIHPEDVFNYYKDIIGYKKQEHFYCLYLNTKKEIIKSSLLFIGTVNVSIVHPREIFKEAYLLSASSIICVHNHPTSNVEPSRPDIDLTINLVKISKLLGISINDHIIIGKNNYYSFYENGYIN